MAFRLTEIVLGVALLSMLLLSCTLQAQGGSTPYDAAEYVPMQRPSSTEALHRRAVVAPDAGGDHSLVLRNCDRCTCCSKGNPGICQTMQCCMETVCTPGQGCASPKAVSCECNNKTCV